MGFACFDAEFLWLTLLVVVVIRLGFACLAFDLSALIWFGLWRLLSDIVCLCFVGYLDCF